jgi:hypothetical protein
MSIETLILNPVEFTPALPEIDLNALGLSIGLGGLDYGESSVTVERVRQAVGEGVTDSHWPSVECTVPLISRGSDALPVADPLHRVEAWVAEIQRRKSGWIRRDFSTEGGFAGSVGCPVDAAGLTPPQSWMLAHNQIEPTQVLKLSRSPIWYATVEIEAGEAKGSAVRDLQIEIAELLGTAPGLIRVVVKNEGAEDWRGCLVSIECDDYSAAPTALPKYEAAKLTPKGGAVISAAAPPEVRAIGTVAAGVGTIAPALPAGTVAGDLLVMVAESGGATTSAEANTALTAAGWTEAPLGSQKQGNTRLTLLYRIATGGDATTTNDTGDHQLARIVGIKAGTFDPVSPFNISARGTQAATKAVSIPGATTTRDNCLIIACASANLPDSTTTAEFSAAANASLTGVTERIDNTTAEGDGGAIWAVTGVLAVHGTYAATTGTAVTEAERAVISLAVNSIAEVVKCPALTAGWQTVLYSEIVGVGHMTHVGPRRMAFRINDVSALLEDVQWKLEWRALGSANWIQTTEGSTPLIVSSPVLGYQVLDLGECRPPQAITGNQRWEWRLQVRSLTGSGKQPLIRDAYPASTEQWMRVADTSENPIDGEPTKMPGTVEDNAGVGTAAWENPGNAKTADGTFALALVGFAGNPTTHYLKATNYGFAIPTGATVEGILVSILGKAEGSGAFDNRVRIIKGGVIEETVDHAKVPQIPSNEWLHAWVRRLYGGSGDLWGQTWLPSDINASTFGVALSLTGSKGTSALVDVVEITVAYTETGSENRICFASRSIEFADTGIRRQHPTDEVWGDLVPDGFLPYSPPSGQSAQPVRALIIPTVGDFDTRADSATVKPSAKVFYRPSYLFAREAA